VTRVVAKVAAVALAVAGLVVLIGGAPVAWLLLALMAIVASAVAVDAVLTGRFLEPLPVIAFASLMILVLRPFQLFIGASDLLSYFPASDPVQSLLLLENQEVALFATEHVTDIEPALTKATAAAALFVCGFALAYALPLGRLGASRISGLGRRAAAIDPRVVVPACLVIGLVAQVAIINRAGGLSNAADDLGRGTTLGSGFGLIVLSSFAIAGVLVWALWRRPTGALEWGAFLAVVAEISAFYSLAGSRARVFLVLLMLVIIWHFRWRPWRFRELAVGVAVFAVFSTSYLVIRSGTFENSFAEAVSDAPSHMVDPRVVLNDNTGFDGLFFATELIGSELPHEHGQGIVDGVLNFVPGKLYPDKPEASEVTFGRQVFGGRLRAEGGGGRPYMVIGEFYRDFGFPGIAVGALLLGLLARILLGLVRPRSDAPGREYRLGLYAIGVVVLYELFIGTYSIAIGFAISLAVPFILAVYALGRLPLGSQSLRASR
jgi:hypothetical protein